MRTFNINGIIFAIIFWIITLPAMAQSAPLNSTINYSADGKSGSFTLLPSDCQEPGWCYYFEINIPTNVLVKITCEHDENVDSNIRVTDINDQIFSAPGPSSDMVTVNSKTGKIAVYIFNTFNNEIANFKISFLEGTYADAEDSYIHGNSIVDGRIGIGTVSPMSKLDVKGDARIMDSKNSLSLIVNNSFQSPCLTQGIMSYVFNPLGPVCGISSVVTGGGDKETYPSYAAIFSGADVSVSDGNLIVSYGKIGIDTNTPTQALSVTGKITVAPVGTDPEDSYNGAVMITKPKTSGQYINLIRKIGVQSWSKENYPWSIGTVYNTSNFAIGTGTVSDAAFTNPYFIINTDGKVGIGTTAPDQALTVKGKIHANEVIIDLNSPIADYVFKPSYKLMPLPEVEQFVKTNSHLPEIPSANEVAKQGMSMGEMQNKLLQKVEELTLYVIQQQKEINQLKRKLKE